jgi:hypothetical protein
MQEIQSICYTELHNAISLPLFPMILVQGKFRLFYVPPSTRVHRAARLDAWSSEPYPALHDVFLHISGLTCRREDDESNLRLVIHSANAPQFVNRFAYARAEHTVMTPIIGANGNAYPLAAI